jgi:type II secretory pathway pseudopilin PulG
MGSRDADEMRGKQQRGFTLLEIVLMVLLVGLILAGILKGEEMVTSAKVKRVAGQLDEIRAAYLGFEDRYKALPGDYRQAGVNLDCGAPCPFGNGDSRIRATETPAGGSEAREDLLVWTHLAAAGFLKGEYRMASGESVSTPGNTPRNPFSAYVRVAFDGDYGVSAGGVVRHNLKSGPMVPVEVAAELDRKTDDGKPYTGQVQFSAFAANGAAQPAEGNASGCTAALDQNVDWNLRGGSTNCGVATLL